MISKLENLQNPSVQILVSLTVCIRVCRKNLDYICLQLQLQMCLTRHNHMLPFLPSPDVNSFLKCSCRKYRFIFSLKFSFMAEKYKNRWPTVPTRLIAQVKQWLAMAAFLASIDHMGSLWREQQSFCIWRGKDFSLHHFWWAKLGCEFLKLNANPFSLSRIYLTNKLLHYFVSFGKVVKYREVCAWVTWVLRL